MKYLIAFTYFAPCFVTKKGTDTVTLDKTDIPMTSNLEVDTNEIRDVIRKFHREGDMLKIIHVISISPLNI